MDVWSHPLVFAHRGASAHAPENTLAAFDTALRQGAHAIELDAKLSADGQVVVIHDATVNRTTDGKGRVSNMELAALRALDAGSFFSDQFRSERIPTLDEVFEMVIGTRMLVNIELTNYTTPNDGLVERVCALVKHYGLEKKVLFSSFLPSNLAESRRLLPDVPQGLLALPGWLGWWSRSFGFNFGDFEALHPNMRDATPRRVARVHRLNRRIHVWTVNTAEDIRRLFGWGVDGIFTDDPLLALGVLEAKL
jgi:glycerophosphoryl diester phosphodiesterase